MAPEAVAQDTAPSARFSTLACTPASVAIWTSIGMPTVPAFTTPGIFVCPGLDDGAPIAAGREPVPLPPEADGTRASAPEGAAAARNMATTPTMTCFSNLDPPPRKYLG